MTPNGLTIWSRLSGPKVKTILATADYPHMLGRRFGLYELEDGTYACDFYVYDAAGGWRGRYFEKVYEQYKRWCDGEEKHFDKLATPRCPKCHHKWFMHERDGGQEPDSCQEYMGMGTNCECKNRIPQ